MQQQFDFDPQLPALPLAFDREAVVRLFEERWPEARAGDRAPVTITSCRLQDTKYQPARRCVTTYELLVERLGSAPWQTIGVVEISATGPAHRLYDDDPQLPWLAIAADPAGIRAHVAALLAEHGNALPIESCTVTPIRYKPGARCVFRYDLHTAAGQHVFFGKLLAEGGAQLMATTTALHQVSRTTPGMPRILPPLAFWPDVRMLVQPAVTGGVELNTFAFDSVIDRAVRERWLNAAGVCLAAFHGSAGADGPARTLDDDLDELREYIAPMAAVNPPLAQQYQNVLVQLTAMARTQTTPTPVASHGAFRTDQFLIEDDHLVMIDLDGFCWADPARDLGNFLAYLRWKAIRNPQQAAFIEAAGLLFLDGYRARRPTPNQRQLAIYQAASLLKIAGRRFRSLTVKEWPLVPQLIDAALNDVHSQ